MSGYPTGAENRNGTLRIWFIHNGKRVRESLGVVDTARNRRIAGELRASVCFAIKTDASDYARQFPQSPNLKEFNIAPPGITVSELVAKWLELRRTDLTLNAHLRYVSYITIGTDILGCGRMVDSITHENVLNVRKELLAGYQIRGAHQKDRSAKKGRTVRAVNVYVTRMKGMFDFAVLNGYISKSPFPAVTPLKKSESDPSPLTRDEYHHFLEKCSCEQIRNLWKFVSNTGIRHGEICALAWEDTDTKNWTIRISRNLTISDHFTPPETENGNRIINLTAPAIEALKSQMAYTRMGKQHQIDVHLREFGRTRQDEYTLVFVPRLTARNGKGGERYSPGSFSGTWSSILRRSWIPRHKSYESRHMYACWALSAGANPNFIAAQMGHTSAQMAYSVYGRWMSDNNDNQLATLNASFRGNVPQIPHAQNEQKQNPLNSWR